jgi:2-haloacid dehalogenase
MAERWATFDCYGTLVDWNAGIGGELERLFGTVEAPRLLERYHELEPEMQLEDPARTYREVLTIALERLAQAEGRTIPEGETAALARSLPGWPVFPEAREALAEARRRDWRLCILSNTDRDLIDASMTAIGVPFERAIVASEIGSYKPAHGHWRAFEQEFGQMPDVHVAASLYHDIAPARELGLTSVWVNRLSEHADPVPTREIPDLTSLPVVLDELVPA